MKLVLFSWLAAVLSTALVQSTVDVYPLHRMSRSQLPLSTLLVPYPRVGKRSSSSYSAPKSVFLEKRLYVARVGKRAYMYAARVGK